MSLFYGFKPNLWIYRTPVLIYKVWIKIFMDECSGFSALSLCHVLFFQCSDLFRWSSWALDTYCWALISILFYSILEAIRGGTQATAFNFGPLYTMYWTRNFCETKFYCSHEQVLFLKLCCPLVRYLPGHYLVPIFRHMSLKSSKIWSFAIILMTVIHCNVTDIFFNY